MKIITPALLLTLLLSLSPASAKDITVVPYPKNVSITTDATPFLLKNGFTISAPAAFTPAAQLFVEDIADLYNLTGTATTDKGNIQLVENKDIPESSYKLTVTADGVSIEAADYKSLLFGLTTFTQMIEGNAAALSVTSCTVEDAPSFEYRAYMLDVARQWNEFETMKQIVDLCRWYKVPYMQIHLSDDQLFTFESKAYPKLTEGKKHYTQEQLKDLVAYAEQRGVIIIPEFDLPGHSTAMRRQMPELFGATNLSMIDVINPDCVAAVKVIAREMMDVFYTSPYFHIGADEVWLGKYQTLDHVKEYVENNKDKVDNVHDLYLRFIVEMHEFVKSQGKQTMVWESFGGKGSKKIEIPTDMFVHAWETLYQRPESLIANGFTIINSTWKPCYTTPGIRWSPEYIYKWNARLWENHWNAAPSYHKPIQLESNDHIMGIQMNAWEMADHEQLLTANERIAAFSETGWNDDQKQSFEDYVPRAEAANDKIMTIIFPATEERSGFKGVDPRELDGNFINYFGHEASVFFKPLDPSDTIHYTTDKSLPTQESPVMSEPLKLTSDAYAKFVMYDKDGNVKAYKSCPFLLKPLDITFSGDLLPIRDPRHMKSSLYKENFCDDIIVTIKNNYPDTKVYYTTDGKMPTLESTPYTEPVKITEKTVFHAAALNKDGKPVGEHYRGTLNKKDRNAPID